jgi:hypothetical protein
VRNYQNNDLYNALEKVYDDLSLYVVDGCETKDTDGLSNAIIEALQSAGYIKTNKLKTIIRGSDGKIVALQG